MVVDARSGVMREMVCEVEDQENVGSEMEHESKRLGFVKAQVPARAG